MKRQRSIATLVQGIKVVLSKYRASLTVKEIELLENAIDLLREIKKNKNQQEDKILIIMLVFQLSKFITHPEVFEKINIAFNHLKHLI